MPKKDTTPRAEILDEAKALVDGDRNAAYGDPNQDFKRTASFWQTYLDGIIERRGELVLLPHDVAVMQDLLKTSRLVWSPERADTWTDKAGYAACGHDTVVNAEVWYE